jgi:hypothetical protein
MRLNFRLAGSIAMMVGVVSCSSAPDALTASRSSDVSQARLAIVPTFSAAAARAYSALVANGGDITNIHVRLTNLAGRVVLNLDVPFPATRDTISIELPVSIQGREEQFSAKIDLSDASGTIQFSSAQLVTARSSLLPPLPRIFLVLQYVGPGASAKSVAVSPGDAVLVPGATQNIIATGAGAGGVAVGDLTVTWTSSDSTIARVTSTGAASALVTARGPRGTVTITARTQSGVVGTAKLTVVPLAGALSTVSGNGQTGAALDTLAAPFTVEVRGTDGGVMAGVLVTFSAVAPGGAVATSSASTDALGRASTRLVLGRDVGTYEYKAVSGSLTPVTVTATATAATVGAATQIIAITPLPTSFKAGVAATQQFSAQLADAKGYYVATSGVVLIATLDITTTSGAKSQQSVRTTSDANGVFTLTLPIFDTAGSAVITITVTSLNVTFSGTYPIT